MIVNPDGTLQLFQRDVYPNMGLLSTGTNVQPDKNELVTSEDNAEIKEQFESANKPTIFMSIGLLVFIAILIGVINN